MASRAGATPSNYESVAEALNDRGFDWQRVTLGDVQSESSNISFEDEWDKFIALVERITTGNSEKASTDVLLSKTEVTKVTAIDNAATDVSRGVDATWRQGSVTRESRPIGKSSSWRRFEQVINPKSGGYENERSFSNSLFDALRKSLNDFVDTKNSKANWIALRNSRIGFGKEIFRTQLGYSKKYGLSKKSIPDHGCFVFRQIEPKSDEADEEVLDMTAVIELKLENSSCKSFLFDVYSTEIEEEPDFINYHGPMGQAMLYSLDAWHCLARSGVHHVMSIPVVVLAGKSKGKEIQLKKAKIEKERRYPLCCLEAHIHIPEYCGEVFRYSADRIILFDGTAGGLAAGKALSAEKAATLINSRDQRAIAIYIRTMWVGLLHAIEVSKNRFDGNIFSPPVSLCCRQLLNSQSGIRAPLIASPIPYANSIQGSMVRIQQGELYKLTGPTRNDFSMFRDLHWFIDAADESELPENCLVKVSCLSVHNTYISHSDCSEALKTLQGACTNNSELKHELSKVLLGYCRIKSSVSLISIMRDLQAGGENFQILEHRKLQEQGRLPQLWYAFSNLVKSLLLPMADVDVIHLDIRSTEEITCNILVDMNSKGKGNGDDNTMELRLIDFDSVVVSGSTPRSSNQYSVFWKHLKETLMHPEDRWDSAYRYLFWQVLWISFMWHPRRAVSVASDLESIPKEPKLESPYSLSIPDKPKSEYFLKWLFVDNFFVDFKDFVGFKNVEALKSALIDEAITRAAIEKALSVFGNVFCSVVHKIPS